MEKLSIAEKQLLSIIGVFRGRYALFLGLDQNRPATKESLISFGKVWIGKDLVLDWNDTFDSFLNKNILFFANKEFQLTEKGEQYVHLLMEEATFFSLEYDNYFALEEKSEAHKVFCERVYGHALAQHGLIDNSELRLLQG